MPTISRFYGITIYMYTEDHNPPHFHAMYNKYKCSVDLKTLKVKGNFPKDKIKILLGWATLHIEELYQARDLMTNECKVLQINPLI